MMPCAPCYIFPFFPAMSKKKKLARFAENATFPNLFQVSYEQLQHEPFFLKGKWHSHFFKNNHPIILELGCGKGDYTTGLAKAYPHRNFIGMDIKGARMWYGAKISQTEQLKNVAFIRSKIQLIDHFFSLHEIDEIWITFPDPQPRKSHEKKRLTSPAFLNRYRKVMKPDGIIHLKTDDEQLYTYTLEVINQEKLSVLANMPDIHGKETMEDAIRITTFYEKMWLEQGLSIKYLQYKINPDHDGRQFLSKSL